MKPLTGGGPLDPAGQAHGHGDKPPSERRLGADTAVLLGRDHLAFSPGEFKFGLDLPTRVSVDGVTQLQPLS
ncbi:MULTISPECIES: hypothetical protein [Sinorhizobium]|uniref:hypothetical protein n=1 Tax=Sinorhizobium TaxID=28105 RepID=UPI0024B05620|nr:hypothetical protein [Sinorhizobium terangae]WFU51828.1 hypothetical protein QA637_30710 [Sinorhizobium terangae]